MEKDLLTVFRSCYYFFQFLLCCSTSQSLPLKFDGHLHLKNRTLRIVQVPPFRQGLLKQGFGGILQVRPEYPTGQAQVKLNGETDVHLPPYLQGLGTQGLLEAVGAPGI